ncbi:GTP 3,8-cyclase MoaA [Sesbania bispinosa]|nr:GTP 3,8-cyclase MoaA [Sesbania bispinosa]
MRFCPHENLSVRSRVQIIVINNFNHRPPLASDCAIAFYTFILLRQSTTGEERRLHAPPLHFSVSIHAGALLEKSKRVTVARSWQATQVRHPLAPGTNSSPPLPRDRPQSQGPKFFAFADGRENSIGSTGMEGSQRGDHSAERG